MSERILLPVVGLNITRSWDVGRAIDQAVGSRTGGPILLNSRGARMDRHAATRRLRHLVQTAGVPITRPHPHMLRHTYVTTMLDAGVDLRDVQIAARHADPRTTMRYDRARKNLDRHPNYILAAYMALRHLTATVSRAKPGETHGIADEWTSCRGREDAQSAEHLLPGSGYRPARAQITG